VNPHFASLVVGLAQQAEAVLSGQLLDQVVTSLRFRYVQTMTTV
jgi:hypothetical protein